MLAKEPRWKLQPARLRVPAGDGLEQAAPAITFIAGAWGFMASSQPLPPAPSLAAVVTEPVGDGEARRGAATQPCVATPARGGQGPKNRRVKATENSEDRKAKRKPGATGIQLGA